MAERPNLQTIDQFEALNPQFGGRMRWLRWRSQPAKRTRQGNGGERIVEELQPNGFADAFVEVGGRIYVNVDEFWRIVNEQNRGSDAA